MSEFAKERTRYGHRMVAECAALVTASCLVLTACSDSGREGSGVCDHTGKQFATADSFVEVRRETVEQLAPNGSSEVINANRDGIIVNVEGPKGKLIDQIVAIYIDDSDSWKTNRYLSCPG